MQTEDILADLRRLRGATTLIAARCRITRSAVSQWRKVPDQYLDEVAAVAHELGLKVVRNLPEAPSPERVA